MREADVIEARFLDLERVAVLRSVRERIAKVGIFLMSVAAAQKHLLAIDAETVFGDLDVPDADTGFFGINDLAVGHQFRAHAVEVRRVRRPEIRFGDPEFMNDFVVSAGG